MADFKHKDRPPHWVEPRPYSDASLRRKTYGPIQPMQDEGLPWEAWAIAAIWLAGVIAFAFAIGEL